MQCGDTGWRTEHWLKPGQKVLELAICMGNSNAAQMAVFCRCDQHYGNAHIKSGTHMLQEILVFILQGHMPARVNAHKLPRSPKPHLTANLHILGLHSMVDWSSFGLVLVAQEAKAGI